MQQEKLFLYDWKRILFGITPPEFMLEIFERTLIVYLLLLITMRLFSKQPTNQTESCTNCGEQKWVHALA